MGEGPGGSLPPDQASPSGATCGRGHTKLPHSRGSWYFPEGPEGSFRIFRPGRKQGIAVETFQLMQRKR